MQRLLRRHQAVTRERVVELGCGNSTLCIRRQCAGRMTTVCLFLLIDEQKQGKQYAKKTWLRNCMGQTKLNSCAVRSVYDSTWKH